jgi:hypothetical protein
LRTLSDDDVTFVQQRLNTRPRKTLKCDSPLEFVLIHKIIHLLHFKLEITNKKTETSAG